MKEQTGFTLAEVLITLGIIGVVAAVTMPVLIANINERVNSERQANIAQKVTQAMEHMRALGKLTQYDSTESFVDELKNHLKISKICYKDNLTDCWPTQTILSDEGETLDVAKYKTGKDLHINTNTNNVGLILADGSAIILNYNNKSKALDVGDRVTASTKSLPVGSGKSKDFVYTTSVTNSIDFVMDVNGKGKPNREKDKNDKYYDIRSFNTAGFSEPYEYGTAGKLLIIGDMYDAVNCSDTSSEGYEYCEHSAYDADYWAGAKYACVKKGMHLPELSELNTIYEARAEYPSLKNYVRWMASNTGYYASWNSSDPYWMYAKMFNGGELSGTSGGGMLTNKYGVVCKE